MAIYACSDIHGQHDLFMKMLKDINFSDDDKLYILGDIIDRGPDSIGLLKTILDLKNATCLLGNHELMMYDHYRGNREHDYWENGNNGGTITKKEFEKLPTTEINRIFGFLEDLYFQIELEIGGQKILLSHSSFMPGSGTMKWQDGNPERVYDGVWNSPWRFWEYEPLETYKQDERFHIIGHVPVQSLNPGEWPDKNKPEMPCAYVDDENHLVNIDLGCARMKFPEYAKTAALCCMNLTKFFGNERNNAFTYYTNEN